MADADTCTKIPGLIPEQNPARTSKFSTHFLYKALVVGVFLAILPLFPSQAPEFINQTVPNRSWELLHIVFVGIAVSYGLFSRRSNEEAEKENGHSKFDSAQSYVSRLLHVSSVFDDEADSPSGSDENRVQTWSSQYFRNEPMVVVAPESTSIDEQIDKSSRIGERPLLLPVRSLKSRVSDDSRDAADEPSGMSNGFSRSSSSFGSKRVSKSSIKKRNGPLVDSDLIEPEENSKENNIVLPSPIPWRSRSGRMEVKEDIDFPSMEESETNLLEARPFRPRTSRSPRPISTTGSPKLSPLPSLSSPRKLSPSPSLSSESRPKTPEDSVRKRSSHKYSFPPVPPPPPPPPPPMNFKSSSMKWDSRSSSQLGGISYEKDMRRSFSSEYRDTIGSDGESPMRKASSRSEVKSRGLDDVLSVGKPMRTIRASETVSGTWKGRDARDYYPNEAAEMDFKDDLVNPLRRKTVGINQSSFTAEKWTPESIDQKPYFMEFSNERRPEFLDKMIVKSDEDSEGEEGAIEGASHKVEEADSSSISDEGPDVDKKADEFIARFREQIRLQRIESIKKSNTEISKKSSR